ncbi:unnamed protein product [Lathyrus sativus]|nr:unnamed protein product [Lathyrus sativus]
MEAPIFVYFQLERFYQNHHSINLMVNKSAISWKSDREHKFGKDVFPKKNSEQRKSGSLLLWLPIVYMHQLLHRLTPHLQEETSTTQIYAARTSYMETYSYASSDYFTIFAYYGSTNFCILSARKILPESPQATWRSITDLSWNRNQARSYK